MSVLSHWRQPAVAVLAALLLSGYGVKLEDAREATRPAEAFKAGPYGSLSALSEAEPGDIDPHRPPRVYKVFFADGEATLTDVGRRAIDAVVAHWREQSAPIRLAARWGREAYDRSLSERRLRRVRGALIERGLDPDRLAGQTVGQSEHADTARNAMPAPHDGAVTVVVR